MGLRSSFRRLQGNERSQFIKSFLQAKANVCSNYSSRILTIKSKPPLESSPIFSIGHDTIGCERSLDHIPERSNSQSMLRRQLKRASPRWADKPKDKGKEHPRRLQHTCDIEWRSEYALRCLRHSSKNCWYNATSRQMCNKEKAWRLVLL
jgi:hypothetical protein